MAWLRKAYDLKTSTLARINIDPMFDFLRADPGFIDLQRDMGLLAPRGSVPQRSDEKVVPPSSPADLGPRAPE
jgi:hypothetical protein